MGVSIGVPKHFWGDMEPQSLLWGVSALLQIRPSSTGVIMANLVVLGQPYRHP